jgi:hypothetical protein
MLVVPIPVIFVFVVPFTGPESKETMVTFVVKTNDIFGLW